MVRTMKLAVVMALLLGAPAMGQNREYPPDEEYPQPGQGYPPQQQGQYPPQQGQYYPPQQPGQYYPPPTQGQGYAPGQAFDPQALDEILKPVALYPDPLLAQVLPAAAYPGEIAAAAQFLRGNPQSRGVDQQPWDISVRAIAHYPDVVNLLASDLDRTAALGQAFATQPNDVTQAIQRLRREAYNYGNLETTPQQIVGYSENYVTIAPATPQYIYVPTYDPYVVYAPRRYWDRPVLSFSFGYGCGSWLTFGLDWYGGSCYRYPRGCYWGPGGGVVNNFYRGSGNNYTFISNTYNNLSYVHNTYNSNNRAAWNVDRARYQRAQYSSNGRAFNTGGAARWNNSANLNNTRNYNRNGQNGVPNASQPTNPAYNTRNYNYTGSQRNLQNPTVNGTKSHQPNFTGSQRTLNQPANTNVKNQQPTFQTNPTQMNGMPNVSRPTQQIQPTPRPYTQPTQSNQPTRTYTRPLQQNVSQPRFNLPTHQNVSQPTQQHQNVQQHSAPTRTPTTHRKDDKK